jgi:hypothetical protein
MALTTANYRTWQQGELKRPNGHDKRQRYLEEQACAQMTTWPLLFIQQRMYVLRTYACPRILTKPTDLKWLKLWP